MLIFLSLLLTCDDDSSPLESCSFPSEPSAASGVLDSSHDCGFWSIAIGEHIYLNLAVDSFESTCSLTLGPGLEENASPSYSDLGDQGAQWTYDFVGVETAEDSEITLECSDGVTWYGRVNVTET